MKLSLIYVQTTDGNNVGPPLGLMYVAAAAREAGHDVQLIDADPDMVDPLDKVRCHAPAVIGLGFLTTEFNKARLLAHNLRNNFPGVILCAGGVHATVDPESVLRDFNVDFCVIGEGERTFVEICGLIEAGRSWTGTRGIAFRENGRVAVNPPRELIHDLDSLPFPARDLVDFPNIYLTYPGAIKGSYVRSTSVVAGRGCYCHCSFCAVPSIFGRGYRLRSPANVIREIIFLKERYGVRGVTFADGTLTANRSWMVSFCDQVLRNNLKFTWAGLTRVDTVDPEMLALMKKAGCAQLDFGLESGSPAILALLDKGVTVEQSVAAVRMTKEAGIRVAVSFILGCPDERIEDLMMTFDLARRIRAHYTVFFFSIPYPGTKLREIAVQRGLLPDRITYGDDWNLRRAERPLISEHIPADELVKYRARFQNHFILRNYFSFRHLLIALRLAVAGIRHFPYTWRGIRKAFRSRRLDSLIEEILVAYRASLSAREARIHAGAQRAKPHHPHVSSPVKSSGVATGRSRERDDRD